MSSRYDKDSNYSLYEKLANEGKISEKFLLMLNSVTMEELIGLKLESMSRMLSCRGSGLPLIDSVKNITECALTRFAYSFTLTKKDASYMLGITPSRLETLLEKHKPEKYFNRNQNEQE